MKRKRMEILMVLGFLFLSFYGFYAAVNLFLRSFSTIKYYVTEADLNSFRVPICLFVYWAFTHYCNLRTLNAIDRHRYRYLFLFQLIDLGLIFLALLIQILLNNSHPEGLPITKVLNVFLLGMLVVAKHIIILVSYKKLFVRQPGI